MSRENTNVTIRMNKDVKDRAQEMFSSLGLSMSTAINVFIQQRLNYGGIPFEIRNYGPNAETIEAIKEIEYMEQHPDEFKSYTDVNEMFKELLS